MNAGQLRVGVAIQPRQQVGRCPGQDTFAAPVQDWARNLKMDPDHRRYNMFTIILHLDPQLNLLLQVLLEIFCFLRPRQKSTSYLTNGGHLNVY